MSVQCTYMYSSFLLRSSQSLLVDTFLSILSLAASVLIILVIIALCNRRGYRMSLNALLLSLLGSDLLMTTTVIPLHIVRDTFGLTSVGCTLWLDFQLVAITSRSWIIPSVVLLFHLHDGLIPIKRLENESTWTTAVSE